MKMKMKIKMTQHPQFNPYTPSQHLQASKVEQDFLESSLSDDKDEKKDDKKGLLSRLQLCISNASLDFKQEKIRSYLAWGIHHSLSLEEMTGEMTVQSSGWLQRHSMHAAREVDRYFAHLRSDQSPDTFSETKEHKHEICEAAEKAAIELESDVLGAVYKFLTIYKKKIILQINLCKLLIAKTDNKKTKKELELILKMLQSKNITIIRDTWYEKYNPSSAKAKKNNTTKKGADEKNFAPSPCFNSPYDVTSITSALKNIAGKYDSKAGIEKAVKAIQENGEKPVVILAWPSSADLNDPEFQQEIERLRREVSSPKNCPDPILRELAEAFEEGVNVLSKIRMQGDLQGNIKKNRYAAQKRSRSLDAFKIRSKRSA